MDQHKIPPYETPREQDSEQNTDQTDQDRSERGQALGFDHRSGRKSGLGLGIEQLGSIAIVRPYLWLGIIAIVSLIALIGTTRINVDDSLTELFRTNSVEFKKYEILTQRFPASEYDVLIVIEHPDLLTPDRIERLREITLELDFVEANRGMISIFSAREPPGKAPVPPPLIPAELPKGKKFQELKQRILTDKIVGEKMISKDGTLALIVMALDRDMVQKEGLKKIIASIRTAVDEQIAGSDMKAQLSGPPVMQLEIRNAVLTDRIIYNGLGFLLGTLVCLIFFRSLLLTLVTIAAPAMAILWSLGALGLMGVRLNLFLNVITPLIMVMAYSDATHMMFVIRRRLARGANRFDAVKQAIYEVGPACVLTSFTTAVALSSLIFASSALIRTFGIVAAISAVISFLAVIILVPVLSVLLLFNEDKYRSTRNNHYTFFKLLSGASGWMGNSVRKHALSYALIGYLLTIFFGAAYLSLEPRYRLADQVPDREEAIAASKLLDDKLTGANPVHIMIELGKDKNLYSRETLGLIAEAQKIMESSEGMGNVWSLEILRRWLVEKGEISAKTLRKYVKILPETLTRRFISEDEKTVLVTGRMPDLNAASLLPVVNQIDRKLRLLRIAHPDYQLSVTGLPAIAARNSHQMIGELGFGLMSTIAVVVALIALVFRSFFAALASIIPNLIPIFAAGGVLYLTGYGLQFSSAVALTVAFGLAVNDTIHFLHRLHLERLNGHKDSVTRTVRLMGPVLMLTTIVLIFGLAVTAFSGLPSLRMFGWLSAITLFAALIGDIILLPAFYNLEKRITGRGDE
jgi:predicted RND superfamily exporter protein